jgi:RHS repeat-associated protein
MYLNTLDMKNAVLIGFILLASCDLVAARPIRYDGVGNTIQQELGALNSTQSLTYNSGNRIIRAASRNGSGIYSYSDGGFRLLKRGSVIRPNEQTPPMSELLNSGNYLTLEKKSNPNGENTGLANHVYVNGVRIASLAPAGSGALAVRYYLTDQVNSVKVVLDGQGNMLSHDEYHPYGAAFLHEGISTMSPKFNSHEKDEESGLDFFNARHYDPEVTHFVTPDTVIDGEAVTQSWNRYMYVQGNPIRYGDPTGHTMFINGDTKFQDRILDDILTLTKARNVQLDENNQVVSLTYHKNEKFARDSQREAIQKIRTRYEELINSPKATTFEATNGEDETTVVRSADGLTALRATIKINTDKINYVFVDEGISSINGHPITRLEAMPRFIGQGHEAIHAHHGMFTPELHTARHNENETVYFSFKGRIKSVSQNKEETKTIIEENLLRSAHNLPSRVSHGGMPLPDHRYARDANEDQLSKAYEQSQRNTLMQKRQAALLFPKSKNFR